MFHPLIKCFPSAISETVPCFCLSIFVPFKNSKHDAILLSSLKPHLCFHFLVFLLFRVSVLSVNLQLFLSDSWVLPVYLFLLLFMLFFTYNPFFHISDSYFFSHTSPSYYVSPQCLPSSYLSAFICFCFLIIRLFVWVRTRCLPSIVPCSLLYVCLLFISHSNYQNTLLSFCPFQLLVSFNLYIFCPTEN